MPALRCCWTRVTKATDAATAISLMRESLKECLHEDDLVRRRDGAVRTGYRNRGDA